MGFLNIDWPEIHIDWPPKLPDPRDFIFVDPKQILIKIFIEGFKIYAKTLIGLFIWDDNIDAIPNGDLKYDGPERQVCICSTPAFGLAGEGLQKIADLSGLSGELKKGDFPDPTQHWGVLVDSYYHELAAGRNKQNMQVKLIYRNGKKENMQGKWNIVSVGTTRFSDTAIKKAAYEALATMGDDYNVYDNNCQTFSLRILDRIVGSSRKKVYTSWTIAKNERTMAGSEAAPEAQDVSVVVSGNPNKTAADAEQRQDPALILSPESERSGEEDKDLKDTIDAFFAQHTAPKISIPVASS